MAIFLMSAVCWIAPDVIGLLRDVMDKEYEINVKRGTTEITFRKSALQAG